MFNSVKWLVILRYLDVVRLSPLRITEEHFMNKPFSKMFFSRNIAALKFTISSSSPDSDSSLYNLFNERRLFFQSEAERIVHSKSDGHLRIEYFSIEKGSITVTIVLGTIGVVYYGISRYRSFVESIQLIQSQLKKMFETFISSISLNANISDSWQPSDDFVLDMDSFYNEKIDRIQLVLIGYLIFSHFILLSVLVYLVLHR
jgi:hypothetical protein